MKNTILIIGYNHLDFIYAQIEWLKKYGIILEKADSINDSTSISKTRYLAIAISKAIIDFDFINFIKLHDSLPPVIILSPDDKPIERADKLVAAIARQTNTYSIHNNSYKENENNAKVNVHRHEDILLFVEYHVVLNNGYEVHLSHTEFRVLELLMANPGWVFSYKQIYDSYSTDREGHSTAHIIDAVYSQIKRIRKKLSRNDNSKEYIITVRGQGYKMGA